MTTFFPTINGAVNAANVAKIRSRKDGGVGFFDAEGCLLGESPPIYSISDYTGTIIPATVGQIVFFVCFYDDGGLHVAQRAVVAWRLTDDGGSLPIVAGDGPVSNERIFIPMPDGRVLDPLVGESDTLDAAIARYITKNSGG